MGTIKVPETMYAQSGEVSIAYQVFGHGKQDLVYVPGIISHLELYWEDASMAKWLTHLGEHFRVIILDKRGQGMSDRIDSSATLEDRIDDVSAVMQAAQSTSATLLGFSEGGPLCLFFAATYPNKVEKLILFGSMARFYRADDYPYSVTYEAMAEKLIPKFGKGAFAFMLGPKASVSQEDIERIARTERMSCSPSAFKKILEANRLIDARPILAHVAQPTLIMHRRGDTAINYQSSRFMAERIPNCTYLEFPSQSHLPNLDDTHNLVNAIVQFAHTDPDESVKPPSEKRLSTALFTDIVQSTDKLLSMGDHAWRNMLDRHDLIAHETVAGHRGRIVKNTGDGILAVFDGPVKALQCAQALINGLQEIGLPIRVGLHVGEVVNRGEDVTGIAVNIAARVMDKAKSGQTLLTKTLKDLTGGSNIEFESIGEFELKGLPEVFELFTPVDAPVQTQ
jgi:class 3 adenylate cyclase/pimeloyl-ACP methyl ester carboxylesterase